MPFTLEVSMEESVPRSVPSDWKELYKAALFEDDDAKIPQRIVDAERALAARAREIFGGEHQVREQQAMENATYFLRLLRQIQGQIQVRANLPYEGLRPAHASFPQPARSV
jgi:hypothetical protein